MRGRESEGGGGIENLNADQESMIVDMGMNSNAFVAELCYSWNFDLNNHLTSSFVYKNSSLK